MLFPIERPYLRYRSVEAFTERWCDVTSTHCRGPAYNATIMRLIHGSCGTNKRRYDSYDLCWPHKPAHLDVRPQFQRPSFVRLLTGWSRWSILDIEQCPFDRDHRHKKLSVGIVYALDVYRRSCYGGRGNCTPTPQLQ
jgi:hypothetical protein